MVTWSHKNVKKDNSGKNFIPIYVSNFIQFDNLTSKKYIFKEFVFYAPRTECTPSGVRVKLGLSQGCHPVPHPPCLIFTAYFLNLVFFRCENPICHHYISHDALCAGAQKIKTHKIISQEIKVSQSRFLFFLIIKKT